MNSDREPVHFSGSIQPHGIVLALSHPELTILQVSANTQDFFNVQPENLLGQCLDTLLDDQFVAAFRQNLADVDNVSPLLLSIRTLVSERYFHGMVHRSADVIILELEPSTEKTNVNFFSVPALIKRAIAKLQQVSSSNDFFDLVTQEVRQLTGFDRVMVYQFDPQGAGEVIAEAKNDDLPPYLRLHYPATDIPQPVRELYTQGLLRFIPDLSVPGVDLLPAENPVTQQPLDLGMAVLRGVDPCCVEYHQNIGVAAILVIALIRDRQLWGLIACHHHTSKYIPYEIREGCELLGQFVSSELASDELARINQELERSNQELDSFAYAASHDLKEPLRGIHNFSTLLLKGYESVLDDTGKARLQTLLRLTRRMESLIDALLKFSRLGQAQLNIQPTDLNELVNQVLEDLHISRQDVQLDIRIPRPLPVVRCDSILMSEVFTNLLSNACKYNDKPEAWIEIGYLEEDTGKRGRGDAGNLYDQVSASPRLSLSASSSQSPLTFYVKDNGIGIRERHLETVFRLFKRLHEQHLYGGGTGAGLTIAKKIIERHGGVIWVESIYGEGSTFYFTLPSY